MTTKEVTTAGPAGHEPPLTIAEAAKFLNVTERWLRRAKDDRRLPYVKLGHHVRFLAEDLRACLQAARVDMAAESVRGAPPARARAGGATPRKGYPRR